MQDKRVRFLVNVAVIAVVLALLYVLIKFGIRLLLPFVIAFVVALIVQRPIDFLSKRLRLNRKIAAPLVTLVFEVVVVGLLVLIIYRVLAEVVDFASRLPTWFNYLIPDVIGKINELLTRLMSHFSPDMAEDTLAIFQSFTAFLQDAIVNFSVKGVNWAASALTQLPSLLLLIIIAVVASFFLAGKTDRIKAGLLRQLSPQRQEMISVLYRKVWRTLWRMIRSYLLLMCITFVELSLGLWLMGLNYFFIIAGLIALVDLLPVLGTGTVLIPWALIELIIGDTRMGICLLALYLVITVVRNVIEPRLVGRQIGLSPILTLMSMYVGLQLFGLLGLFLLPMLLILVKSMNDMGILHLWKPAEVPEEASGETPSETAESPEAEAPVPAETAAE